MYAGQINLESRSGMADHNRNPDAIIAPRTISARPASAINRRACDRPNLRSSQRALRKRKSHLTSVAPVTSNQVPTTIDTPPTKRGCVSDGCIRGVLRGFDFHGSLRSGEIRVMSRFGIKVDWAWVLLSCVMTRRRSRIREIVSSRNPQSGGVPYQLGDRPRRRYLVSSCRS